jgi:hypothetical protein
MVVFNIVPEASSTSDKKIKKEILGNTDFNVPWCAEVESAKLLKR